MNTSTLVEMIKKDPSILDDVPGLLKRLNEKTILHKYTVRERLVENETYISFAEQWGGEATERDVEEARKLVEQEPIKEEMHARLEAAKAAIEAGEIATVEDLKAKIEAAVVKVDDLPVDEVPIDGGAVEVKP